jgi:integrase
MDEWIDTKLVERKGTKNPKALATALRRHLKPIAALPMASVASADIAKALKPLADRPAMRDTITSLIHSLFDWAMAADIIPEALNPARRRKLNKLLPERTTEVKNHRFLVADELPGFMARLAEIPGTVARALELLIHLGLRQAEIRCLEWTMVDLERHTISLPASVMKAGKAHTVYLSDRAFALVMGMLPLRRPGGAVFPGRGGSRTLGERSFRSFLEQRFPELGRLQPHGARSALKTWGTTTRHRREIVEITLAHRLGDVVEASYFNGEDPAIQAARRELYRDWSAFLMGQSREDEDETTASNVVALHRVS